jgi:hypothetical protein
VFFRTCVLSFAPVPIFSSDAGEDLVFWVRHVLLVLPSASCFPGCPSWVGKEQTMAYLLLTFVS